MIQAVKRFFAGGSSKSDRVALQPPGAVFPWPRLTKLTAMEEVVIGVPKEILGASETIGTVIRCDPDVQIHIPTKPDERMIMLRLKTGMAATLTKSCQAVIVADDRRPRRIQVGVPEE